MDSVGFLKPKRVVTIHVTTPLKKKELTKYTSFVNH